MVLISEEKLRKKIEKRQRHIYCSDPSLYHILEEKYVKNGWNIDNGQQWVLRDYSKKRCLDFYYSSGRREWLMKNKQKDKKEMLGGDIYIRKKKPSESWEEYQNYIHKLKEKLFSKPGLSQADRENIASYHKKRDRLSSVFVPQT